MKMSNLKLDNDLPFKSFVLTNSIVKNINREFEFYGVQFYRDLTTSEFTVYLKYPYENMYRYILFKKYISQKLLNKDKLYESEWEKLFKNLKIASQNENEELYKYKLLNPDDLSNKLNILMNTYNLRDYQAYDLYTLMWKMNCLSTPLGKGGLILSEQRTGKSRIALSYAKEIDSKEILLICPKTTQIGWIDEIKKFNDYLEYEYFIPQIIKTTSDCKTMLLKNDDQCIVKIISYDLFKMLTDSQIKIMCEFPTSKITLILDEVHRLRHFKSLQSQAIFNFKKLCIKNKIYLNILGMSGTPAVKETTDIFGQLAVINFSTMGFQPYYKDFNQFKDYFYLCEDTSYGKLIISLTKENELLSLIKMCSVQTKQKDLDLFKNYTVKHLKIELDMDSQQEQIYKSVRDDFQFQNDIDCENALVQLTRLQQICIDPSVLVASYEPIAPKIKRIVKFIKKNPNANILIISKKRMCLDNLMGVLQGFSINYSSIVGKDSLKSRLMNIENFQNGITKIMILQFDTGKEGLTLPKADCTIFLDRDFAQGYNEQAEARMTPLDGRKVCKYVIDLVMKNTVEESIHEILIKKKESINSVNTIFKIIKGE